MIGTIFFILMICAMAAWCFYDMRQSRKRLDNIFDKELDNFRVSGYNKEREEFIERMIKLKLVYNADTDAWDKLKEFEE